MSAARKLQPVEEAPAPIGHNGAPAEGPYPAIKAHVDDLMVECRAWCDGAAVENQAQADDVSRLMEDVRQAIKAADEARVTENKPFDDGKAEVQARYNPMIADTKTQKGSMVLALDALKAAIAPFLKKLDDEKKAAAAAAQAVADAKASAAADAIREAAQGSDIGAREQAEAMLTEARQAGRAATQIANTKVGGFGGARAVSLRSEWKPVLVTAKAALTHYATTNPDGLKAWLISQAEADVRAGKRQIPGFTISEERVAV